MLTDFSREELKQEVLSDVDDFRVDFGNSVSDKEDGEESAPELESKKLELKNKGSLSKSDSNGDDGGLFPFTLSLTFCSIHCRNKPS